MSPILQGNILGMDGSDNGIGSDFHVFGRFHDTVKMVDFVKSSLDVHGNGDVHDLREHGKIVNIAPRLVTASSGRESREEMGEEIGTAKPETTASS